MSWQKCYLKTAPSNGESKIQFCRGGSRYRAACIFVYQFYGAGVLSVFWSGALRFDYFGNRRSNNFLCPSHV